MIAHSRTSISKEEIEAVTTAVYNGNLTKGKGHFSLQEEFQEVIGADFVHLSSSGTMAFFLILKALDIKKGDEVLLPDYICNSLLGPILNLSAIPVLYDNEKDNWISSPDSIYSKISHRTRVLVVNHTFGRAFTGLKLLSETISSNISIVEDCCHVIIPRTSFLSQFIGKYSLCAFYSFNATKILASGEGGAISSNDEIFAHSVRAIEIGDNLSDLSCTLARVQLKKLNYFLDRRKEIATIYLEEFKEFVPNDCDVEYSIFYRFPLLISENEEFWTNKHIAYRKGVDSLLSQKLEIKSQPNALSVFERTVSLPIYPTLKSTELKLIIEETHKLILNGGKTPYGRL